MISKILNRILGERSDDMFDALVDIMLENLDEDLSDEELEALSGIIEDLSDISAPIEENLMESYGGSVNIAPPKWIASGGASALLGWNKITEALKDNKGKVNYHKAISRWKDWEATIHGKARLKAQKDVSMEDLVKERFKKELEQETKSMLYLVFLPSKLTFSLFNSKGRNITPYNHSSQYLNKISTEYFKLTKRSPVKGIIEQSVKEEKANSINENLIKSLLKKTHEDRAMGISISQENLSEFTKRTYHALKHYREKEQEKKKGKN